METNQQKMEEKWFIARKRHVPCVWPLHTFWAFPVHEYFSVPTTGKVFSVWEKGDYTVIFDKPQTGGVLGKAVAQKILEKSDDLKTIRAQGIKAGENTVAFTKNFAEKSVNASIDDYISFFDVFTLEYVKIMKDNMHYWVMGSLAIEKMIRNELVSYSPAQVSEIFTIMSPPVEISYSSRVDSDLKHLITLARDGGIESIEKAIEDFSTKFFWFPYEYVGPGIWDKKAVTALIQKKLTESAEIHSVSAGDETLQEKCIADHSLSEKVTNLFKILQTLTLLSDDRKRYNSEICYYLNGVIFSNLAQKLGVSREDALYIDQEFLKIFEKDKELFKKRLAKRAEMLVEMTVDGVFTWHEGREECNKFLQSLDVYLDVDKNVKEVRGQIAFKGKVTGRVRVLKTSHVDDFAEGDIIVTGMTTPDFVPLIQKASAIVTNEGGITCHAAIVAREMKKPCVIGTKIATQVFKDEDVVEVDAMKGIVRIIKEK